MGRWEPGAEQRLQQAAMTLFLERGYDNVTVAEIAEKAGLTRRTFFNHFGDKREIFSSGAEAFRASVSSHLAHVDGSVAPLEAAVAALSHAGAGIADYRRYAAQVRAIVASAPELQERELSKLAHVTTLISQQLQRRGSDARSATIVAKLAVTAFSIAWDDCISDDQQPFEDLMRRAVDGVRAALCGDENPPIPSGDNPRPA
jgi:AcrR family transcriptional regulator